MGHVTAEEFSCYQTARVSAGAKQPDSAIGEW
jgi:hypothetical protein